MFMVYWSAEEKSILMYLHHLCPLSELNSVAICFCYENLFAWILCRTSVNSTKSVQIFTLSILWIKALCKYWPWFKNVSALGMMELSSGLTCQQKSAGSHMKLGKENAAAAPVPSLLPAYLSQTAAFSQPRLPCLCATAPQLPLTHTPRSASHSSMGSGQTAFWNPARWWKRDSNICRLLDTLWANPDRKVKQSRFHSLVLFADMLIPLNSLSLPEMILRKYLKCISRRFQIRHQRKRLAASLHLISNWELCSSGLCTGWHCSLRKRANMARAFFQIHCENPPCCRAGSVWKQQWQSTLPAAPSEVHVPRCPVSADVLLSFWAENVTFLLRKAFRSC